MSPHSPSFSWYPWNHGSSAHRRTENPFLRLFFRDDSLPASLPDPILKQFEQIGVFIKGPHPESADFLQVRLPYWWNKVRRQDSAIFALVDKDARERACCRLLDPLPESNNAWGSLTFATFVPTRLRLVERPVGEFAYSVNDGTNVLLSTESLQEALTYLAHFYPEWQNPSAYWDSGSLRTAASR